MDNLDEQHGEEWKDTPQDDGNYESTWTIRDDITDNGKTITTSGINNVEHDNSSTTSTLARYAVMAVEQHNNTNEPQDYILVDSGAAVSVCPKDYKKEHTIHHDYNKETSLTAANGTKMVIYGKRRVDYSTLSGIEFSIDYYVCDTNNILVSTNDLAETGISTTFGKQATYRKDHVTTT